MLNKAIRRNVLDNVARLSSATPILSAAVEDGGYHALGLDWVNGLETDARGTNVFYQCNADACFEGVWHEAFAGAQRIPGGIEKLRTVQPPVDRRLVGKSSWLRVARLRAGEPE